MKTLSPSVACPRPSTILSASLILSLSVVGGGGALAASEHAAREDIPNIVVIGVQEKPLAGELLQLNERAGSPAMDGAELLRAVNGLSLGRFGGRGLEPILRGQSQGRINVLLDGSYVHGGCPNRMDPPTSFASVNNFERITVLKGVQTLRYGGGGSGGTLVFERENEPARDGFSGRVRASMSDNNLGHDLATELAYSKDRFYARLNLDDRSAGNYRDGDGRRVRSAWREDSQYLAFGLRLRQQDRLELTYESSSTDDALFPGAGMDAPYDSAEHWRLNYKAEDIAGLDRLSVETWRADVEHLMDNYSNRALTGPMALRVPSTSDTAGLRIIAEVDTAVGTAWTAGLDYQANERLAIRYMGPTIAMVEQVNAFMWPDATLEQAGLFVEFKHPLSGFTQISGGLRFDRVQADASLVTAEPPSPMLAGPNALYAQYYGSEHRGEQQENNWGGLLRIEHALSENATLFAGLSQTTRTADSSERFLAAANGMPRMRWIGNPGLNPEQHRQLDAGAIWRAGAHRIDTVVFADEVDDYILRDRAHGQAGVLQNDGASIYRNVQARLYGVEGDWQWSLSEALQLSASAAWVRARNTSDNRDIAQTPPLNGALRLSYQQGNWQAGSELRWSAQQNKVEDNPAINSGLDVAETPGWAVMNLYLGRQFGAWGLLRAGVDNVFDRRYAEHVSRANLDPFYPEAIRVNEPGRVLWARYEYSF